ncbi:MAG: glycosyltransferase family 2 protein, partial [bacterium]|nr:glycosyltransferase family 2 protein [bacterium]
MKNNYLSVVIPAFNEKRRIVPTLRKIRRYLETQGFLYEIIVVDDGSTDGMAAAIKKEQEGRHLRLLKNDINRGKGYSVRKGMLAASGELILFSDADLSTPIEEVEKLLQYLANGRDIAIGSRALSESKLIVPQNWCRQTAGRTFNLLVQTLALRGIKDTQCGFKLFTRRAARMIFSRQRFDGFGFDVEVLYLGKKLGFKIAEVPVKWLNSPGSKVHILNDSTKMFLDLFRLRVNDLLGQYTITPQHLRCPRECYDC